MQQYLRLLERWKEEYAPKQPEDDWNPLFVETLHRQPYIEYVGRAFLQHNSMFGNIFLNVHCLFLNNFMFGKHSLKLFRRFRKILVDHRPYDTINRISDHI
jgi:hypothetical protein